MSSHPNIIVGCYIQVNAPKANANLDKIIYEDFVKENLFIVPSECFPLNRTIICSNHKKDGIVIDADYQDGEVWPLDDLNIQEDKGRFERKFKKVIDVLKEHYEDVKIRFGVIHYWH